MSLKSNLDNDQQDELIQNVESFFVHLDKNIKLSKLYSLNNPILTKHQIQLFTQISDLFQKSPSVTVLISPKEITFQSKKVYSNDNPQESFAFKLFNDGIRSITLNKGLGETELNLFVTLLGQGQQKIDDDTYGQLWENEFKHISYTIADTLVDSQDIDLESQSEYEEKMKGFLDTHKSQSTDQSNDINVYQEFNITVTPQSMGKLFENKISLNQTELDSIQNDLNACDKNARLIIDFADMVLCVLQEENDEEEFKTYLGYMGQALDACFQNGDLTVAQKIAEQLHTFPTRSSLKQVPLHDTGLILSTVWSTQRVDLFLLSVATSPHLSFEIIENIVSLMDPMLLSHLLKKAFTIADLNKQKAVLRGIARLHKGDIGVFTSLMQTNDLGTIRSCLYILTLLKHPSSQSELIKLLKHTDINIKKEAIVTLKYFPSNASMDALLSLLQDNEKDVRLLALSSLAKIGDRKIASKLGQIMTSKEFKAKTLNEKKSYFQTVSKIIGEEFFQFLTSILDNNNWLNNQQIFELQQCAIYALSCIGTDNAKNILNEYNKKNNKSLARYYEMALKQFETQENT